MKKELVYQPPKWEKEQREYFRVLKQTGGKDCTLKSLQSLIERKKESPESRDYATLYRRLYLKYHILAGDMYLIGSPDQQCITYTYLSGMSAILAYLFHMLNPPKDLHETDRRNIPSNFILGMLELYAVNQPLPACIRHIDNPDIQLLMGDEDDTAAPSDGPNLQPDPEGPYRFEISEGEQEAIRAVRERDSKTLKERLVKWIRAYRREPLGYADYVDIYSIAFIKLAHKLNMDCDINIIEIPSFFFDDAICRIDPAETQVPFFEDAKAALKQYGLDFEL